MLFFAAFVVALAMTMALIPPLIGYAGTLQLLDQPSDRKVHVVAIPRVGGVGMVLGVLLPILLWVPLNQEVKSLLAGIGILIVMLAVVGFLRFNTYPASVFMGDKGSQFLGFAVVTLLIMLTQKTNPALNPDLPLLLLGVPLFDTAFVVIRRVYYGKSPFVADKNHIHHQSPVLNFDHYVTVIIIYRSQALFVVSAVLLRYNSDLVIVSLWILVNSAPCCYLPLL